MNLRLKFTIPVLLGFFISILLLLFIAQHYLKKTIDVSIKNTAEIQNKALNNSIKKIEEKSLITSAFYASLKTIKNALDIYSSTSDIDTSAMILANKYNSLKKSFDKNVKNTFDIAFYSKDRTCIYRSWDTENGDVVSNYNVKNTLLNKKSSKGVIVDKFGIYISAISLVYDKQNKNILGVCEIRFPIEDIINESKLSKNEELGIFINNGIINSLEFSTNLSQIGKYLLVSESSPNFKNQYLYDVFQYDIVDKRIVEKDNFVFSINPIKNESGLIIGTFVYQMNISDELENLHSINKTIVILVIIILILITLFFHFYVKLILTKPLHKVGHHIENFSKGIIDTDIKVKSKDEIGVINRSLKKLSEGLIKLTEFAKNIGNGKFDAKFEPLSDKDEIGKALIDMRDKLKEAKEKEKEQKAEEQKRSWATQGLALFGEILRQNDNNMEEFGKNIIQNLVKYTNSNQGALFILEKEEDKEPYLNLLATYAYSRFKYSEKTIELGEGLVGTCAIEKETIYLTDVPDDYIQITSGLGEALPRNVIIVPLKVEEEVYGVIELASFNIFEDYQKEFIETLAKNIASSIHSTKTNILTAQLLEQSRQQQEEMKAQEEELRQNMEELMATQEEAMRRESEMKGLYSAINDNQLVAEYQIDGTIEKLNHKYEELFDINTSDFIGQNYDNLDIIPEEITNEELWEKLKNKEVVSRKIKVNIFGKEYWLQETYSPIIDDSGDIIKIISISSDITEEKLKEQELKQNHEELKAQEEEMRQNMEELLATQEESMRKEAEMTGLYNAISSNSLVAEFDVNGRIININDKFAELFKIDREEFIGANYNDLNIDTLNDISNEELWDKIKNREVVSRKIKITTSKGDVFWLHETFAPIEDEGGDIVKVVDVSHNITEEKLREAELTQNQEEMKAQEEEMRQNMEELLVTQEESMRKEAEMEGLYNAINSTQLIAEYTPEGVIEKINDKYTEVFGDKIKDVVGNNYKDLDIISKGISNEELWEKLLNKEIVSRNVEFKFNRKKYKLTETFSAIFDEYDEIIKVISLSSTEC